jgi:hypothetical protein
MDARDNRSDNEDVHPTIIVAFKVDSSIVRHDATTDVGPWCPFKGCDMTDVAAGSFLNELAKEKPPPTIEMCALSISST